MRVFAGSYTKMIDAGVGGTGEGVYCLNFDKIKGSLSVRKKINIDNPSYLCLFNDILYTFNEVARNELPYLFEYRIEKNGDFVLINKLSIPGDYPCHITFSAKYRCLFVSCYGSGNVLVFSVNGDGSLGSLIQDLQHSGNSINRQRQNGPHAHCVVAIDENDEAYMADLGTDKIHVYKMNERNGKVTMDYQSHIQVPSGWGPRHLVANRSCRLLFVVTELVPQVLVIDIDKRKIISSVKLSSTVSGPIGSCSAIKISNDGNYLYVSERNSHRVFIFLVDDHKGCLKLIDEIKTNVKTPRDFFLDESGHWLIVAGQDSDSLSVYKRNIADGSLKLHDTREGIRSISCLI